MSLHIDENGFNLKKKKNTGNLTEPNVVKDMDPWNFCITGTKQFLLGI